MLQTIQQLTVSTVAVPRSYGPSRAALALGASGVVLVAASLFVYLSYENVVYASAAPVLSSDSSGENAMLASAPMVTHQMTIGNNGIVYLQNATLEAISGESATIESSWGAESFSWHGEITSATKVFAGDGSAAALSDLEPGQLVTVTGQIDTSSATPAIEVQFIRE